MVAKIMYAETESTIPINLIRLKRRTDGFTPPPNVDVEFVIQVRLHGEANFYAGLFDNEPSGVFVPTYRRYRLGTLVAIALDVPGRADLIVINTVVRWLRDAPDGSEIPPGMGLEFLAVNEKARAVIRTFAARRAPLLFEAD